MKKSMPSLVLVAVAMQASAAQPPSVDRLVDCAAIANGQERLACFDREVAPLAGLRSRPPAPAPDTASAPEAQPASSASRPPRPAADTKIAPAAPTASFGEESLASKSKKEGAQAPESLHAKIERLRPAGTGIFLVYLDNGQAWRHADGADGSFLHEGDAVTITKGALNTYRLTRDAGSTKNWIHVSRVR